MCETVYCVTVWLPDSIIVSVSLSVVGGLAIWKLVKSLIDSIPIAG